MKKIAFWAPHLTEMGTEVMMYDFADFNEKILKNESIIIYNENHPKSHTSVIKKFEDRFDKIYKLKGPSDIDWHRDKNYVNHQLDEILEKENCFAIYMQKFGINDGVVSKFCRTCILCAAPVCDPHGDVYAYVSEWLSQKASNGLYPSVPGMITPLPDIKDDFRSKFEIPNNAIVFGRNGGYGSFDIEWVKPVISKVVDENDNIYFLFQNTPVFYNHPRIIHIECDADLTVKTKFINTCDAMIHARMVGESFGCACGEFASKNKPIITYIGSADRNHITLMSENGYYYNDQSELLNILVNFQKDSKKDWNVYKDFTPEKVMKKFDEVFLK